MVDSRILCRMRAVRGDSDSLAGKYRWAGRREDRQTADGLCSRKQERKRFLRLTGLSPRGFLGLTSAAPLRVVVSPPLAAMSIYAAFGSENRTTALAGEGKQANRPAGVGNAPLLVLTHHFPRRGKSALRSALGIISTSLHSTAKSSPSGGKVVPKVPKGGAPGMGVI